MRRKRSFFYVNDRRAEIVDLTPRSDEVVRRKYQCPGRACPGVSLEWSKNPQPIDIEVEREPGASQSDAVSGFSLTLLDAAVVDVLAPYCRHIYFGSVTTAGPSGQPVPTRFVTVAAPKQHRIQSTRGRFCRHFITDCCGVAFNEIGWASEPIVERTLDDRLVYIDQSGWVLVADELVERLELKRRFPKLWLYRVDVVTEPLDGEVLPGDPGYKGVFIPNPNPPVLPKGKPRRGRVTYD